MRSPLALVGCLLASSLFAAPVPPDEKPKPRAKLVGTLTLDVAVNSAFWLSDGKHIVLVTPDRVLVYPREAIGTDKSKPTTAFDRPGKGSSEVGLTPDGGLFVLVAAGQKVLAENRLHVWEAKTLTAGGEPKADRVIDLEVDNPRGLVISADGKSLFAHTAAPVRFVRMSAKTGDVVKSVPLTDLTTHQYAGNTFDPKTGRLYLAVNTGDDHQLECRDTENGKQLWERKLEHKASGSGSLLLSPNGEQVAFHSQVLVPSGPRGAARGANPFNGAAGGRGPGAGGFGGGGPGGGFGGAGVQSLEATPSLTLFGTKSGTPGAELVKGDTKLVGAFGFSSDGRLLFGRSESPEGGRLVVWDTKAATEVKGWARSQTDVSAAFHPNGYELLMVERDRRTIYGPAQGSPGGGARGGDSRGGDAPSREVLRVENTSTVGVWDLTPVVK